MRETAHVIDCHGESMVAILHRPSQPPTRGIVMITAGGPQYRVGGHRQLTLWARALCGDGLAVCRFDYRGQGDSGGAFLDFDHIDEDIQSAIDHLTAECPSVREVVLWGECNAASAVLYYAHRDRRVCGAVLLNPWVRTEVGAAKATLKHYYLQRLQQPSFWRKLVSGRFNPWASMRSLVKLAQAARGALANASSADDASRTGEPIDRALPLTEGLLQGLQRFDGRLLVVLSGRDPVAQEFDTVVRSSEAWQGALSARQTETQTIATGDHTFSSAEQRNQVLQWASDWLRRLPARR